MTTLQRVRLSRGSVLVQVAQSQPIIGTPALVPVPRNSSSMPSSAAPPSPGAGAAGGAASFVIAAPVDQGRRVLLAGCGGAEGRVFRIRRLAARDRANQQEHERAAEDRDEQQREENPRAAHAARLLLSRRILVRIG